MRENLEPSCIPHPPQAVPLPQRGRLRKQIARIAIIATFFDGAEGRFDCKSN
jgi:hypothetical protein